MDMLARKLSPSLAMPVHPQQHLQLGGLVLPSNITKAHDGIDVGLCRAFLLLGVLTMLTMLTMLTIVLYLYVTLDGWMVGCSKAGGAVYYTTDGK